ncbi:MAG: adenosine deaminase [Erysipelotrichales bacterium]|nr:adenosine deaminase [Erysipelotrichales bacterium]
MIDLHLHLDGSISPNTLIRIAKKENIKIPTFDELELIKFLQCPIDCKSLNDYLTRFDLPGLVMQTKYGLSEVMYDLLKRLNEQGIIYTEIRFAPQLHLKQGLSQEEVVEAVLEGMNKAMVDYPIKAQVILCCMRGEFNHELNLETVRVAKKYLNAGVCAIDLAGAEALFKTHTFKKEFELAKELEIPFTIHAGESDSIDSIKTAIEFGAKRIGHGIRAVDDEDFMKYLAENKIGIEMCPTSNLQTKAVQNIEEYPLKTFMKHGMLVTINTDNMTVSQTNIEKEFKLLEDKLNLTPQEKEKLLRNAVEISFTNDKIKEELLRKMGL